MDSSYSSLFSASFTDENKRSSIISNERDYCQPNLKVLSKSTVDSLDLGYHTLDTTGWSSARAVSLLPRNRTSSLRPIAIVGRITDLDDKILSHIIKWLNTRDRCALAQTCSRLRNVVWKPAVWKELEISHSQNVTVALRTLIKRDCHSCVQHLFIEGVYRIQESLPLFPFASLITLSLRCLRQLTDVNVTLILDNCVQLKKLDLTGCGNISKAQSHVRVLKLQSLDLSDCSDVDDSKIVLTLSQMPNLISLYLRRCIQITDSSLVTIGSYCNSLRQLSVSDCLRITDFGVRELAARLGSSLRYFSVGKCDQVSDAGLYIVAKHCYKLRYLNARGCEALSDGATIALAKSCSRLRALDLGKCDIGDVTLEALSIGCPNLKKLSLAGCEHITDVGIEALAYYVRGLRQLNITDCTKITGKGYRAVKHCCRRCTIEHNNPGFCN